MAKFQESSRGPLRGRVRFGETDGQTRGKRTNRLTEVSMLPSRRAIVNVYQLMFRKKSEKEQTGRGGKKLTPEEREERAQKKQIKQTIYGFNKDDSMVSVDTVDGVKINKYMVPVRRDEDSFHEYKSRGNKFIFDQKTKKNPAYANVQYGSAMTAEERGENVPKTPPKTEAEKEADAQKDIRQRNLDAAKIAQEKEFDLHKSEPRWILWRKYVKANAIPTQPTISKLENDPSYSRYDPTDDYARIVSAFEAAKKEKVIKPKPGMAQVIIPIQTTMSQPPQYYYIKNSLSYRRKKPMKSSTKRHVIKAKSGKRRVVMKKKGGKR